MRPAVRKKREIGAGIAFVLILLTAGSSRAAAAEKTPPSIRAEAGFLLLADRSIQTMGRENPLQTTGREAAEAASRPDLKNLSDPGKVTFAEQPARSAQPKMKKMDAVQTGALLQKETGHSTRFLHGRAGHSADRGLPPYSGASLFFFNDAIALTPGLLPFSDFRMILFRLSFIAALTLVFSLPAMAIEMRAVHRRRTGRSWIASYPFKEEQRLNRLPSPEGYLKMKKGFSG